MNTISNQKGASIIAVVAVMLILAVMGAALISLVTTGSDISINQLQSEQALYIADGGLQYALQNKPYPNYSTNGSWTSLGAGRFKVDTPAYLTSDILAGAAIIPVDSIASFPSTGGRITIGTDFGITYAATSAAACAPFSPPCFTGASGGQAHSQFDSVYPAARVTTTIPSDPSCASRPTIDVINDDTAGFQIPLVIFIDTEYFYCEGKTTIAPFQFQNCIRCYMGSPSAAHPVGSYVSQHILTSTGQVTNILSSPAQRVVKANALPRQ